MPCILHYQPIEFGIPRNDTFETHHPGTTFFDAKARYTAHLRMTLLAIYPENLILPVTCISTPRVPAPTPTHPGQSIRGFPPKVQAKNQTVTTSNIKPAIN